MHKIIFFVIFLILTTYSYPPDIKSLIDTINYSAGDAEVDEDYINNFGKWVTKLDNYFYTENMNADIGIVLFSAYYRFPSADLSSVKDSIKIPDNNTNQDNKISKDIKLLNALVHSKDSLSAITLKLLYENSQLYYNSFPEVQNVDYENFKKSTFNKMVKGPHAGLEELSLYVQTIKYDKEHKQEIDSICQIIFKSDSNSLNMSGLICFCISCLEDSLTDKAKLLYYMRVKEIEDMWDYHEGNVIAEEINKLKSKLGIIDDEYSDER